MPTCYRWGYKNIEWKNVNWLWSECKLAEEVAASYDNGVDASKIYEEEKFWIKDLEKKKRLIRLICKVKNEKYDETKEVRDIKVKISDVKLVVKKVLDIELKVKE